MHLHQQERHKQCCNSTVSAQSSPSSPTPSSFEGYRKVTTVTPSPPPISLAESFFDCISTQNKQQQPSSYHPTDEEQEQLSLRTTDEREATLGLLILRYGQSNNDSGFSTTSTTSLSSNTTNATKVVTLKQNNTSSRQRQRQKRGDKPNRRSSEKKPRWQDPERGVLFKAIIQDKNLEDMSTFNWDTIAKVVGRCGKACKDQWRREILPGLKRSVGIEDKK